LAEINNTLIAQLYTLWSFLLQLIILVGANLVFRPYKDNVNWMVSFTYASIWTSE
jgi:hypothetical protein